MVLATAPLRLAWAQQSPARLEDVEVTLDHYAAAKTAGQRAAAIDYLTLLDRKLVAGAVIDHIIASRTGAEATLYNGLVEVFAPEGCAALLDRLGKTRDPIPEGKLIVAMGHCQGDGALKALEGCLDDKRPVPFEARGPQPRRICDLAYDELFLRLRTDPAYGLDPTPKMQGVISERTPVKARDALIAKLKAKLAQNPPTPVASPAPSPTPAPSKPTTAALTV